MNTWSIAIPILLWVFYVEGCRYRKTGNSLLDSRKQISADNDVDQELSNFFSSCMFQKTGSVFPSWISVVDFVLRDTRWFSASDEQFCKEKMSGEINSVECWQHRMDRLVRNGSELLSPAKDCVAEYLFEYDFVNGRAKFTTPSTTGIEYCLDGTEEEYNQCVFNKLLTTSNKKKYSSLRDYHQGSVEQFVKNHISNCRIKNAQILGSHVYTEDCTIHSSENSRLCISTVFQEIVKASSPLYEATTKCIVQLSQKSEKPPEKMASNKRCDLIICTQDHQHCDENKGVCICDSGYKYNLGKCRLISNKTTENANSKCNDVTCGGVHQHCDEDNGNCVCNDGYEEVSGQCQTAVVPSSADKLDSENKCSGVTCEEPHQRCDAEVGACVCDVGFKNVSGKCTEDNKETKPNENKTVGRCRLITCIGLHQHCDEEMGACVCDEGYKYISEKCQKVKHNYSKDHNMATYKCQRTICGKQHEHCNEMDGTCICDDGYKNVTGQCVPVQQTLNEDETMKDVQDSFPIESILFTLFDEKKENARVRYLSANSSMTQVIDGDLAMKTLMDMLDGKDADYWGMVASYETGKIYFNDYKQACLHEYDAHSNKIEAIANDLTGGLENLEYDRITNVLYWTDSIDKTIIAMEGTYQHFTKIYQSDSVAPYGLALHTTKRMLFFSVYKLEKGFISDSALVKCDLDGGNQESILQFPYVIRPRSLAIDYATDNIYWTDVSMHGDSLVMMSKLDGTQSKSIFSRETGYFWGIAISQENIYVTNTLNVTTDKYETYVIRKDGRSHSTITTNTKPRHVSVYASNEVSTVPVKNECEFNKCDHICLSSSTGEHRCMCSSGFQLKFGSICETSPLLNDYLLVADIGQKGLFQIPFDDKEENLGNMTAIDVHTTEKIYAVAVDPSNGEMAWYDLEKEEIFWGHRILSFGEAVSSIVIHPCEEKIYWASITGIYSWDGKRSFAIKTLYTSSVFTNMEIREIEIDFLRSRIYWTEYDALFQKGRIMQSNLDGKNRKRVLDTKIVKGMTIDYETDTMYVMSMVDGTMYSIQLDQANKLPLNQNAYSVTKITPFLKEGTFLIFDVSVFNGWVYLADSEASHIHRFDLKKGPSSMESHGPSEFFFVPTMTFYSEDYFKNYIKDKCPTDESSTSPPNYDNVEVETGDDDCEEILLNGSFSDYLDCMFGLLEAIM
uniref:prolow-density lipoprotein receptor-related protein 1-like isoform X2 n=1 Tax=Styela clava TaxID=7725 RepID=UPI0019398451|nr:prolow-density lipoprotein receptor-related protein 1-like isoform X2 [Styela clava]